MSGYVLYSLTYDNDKIASFTPQVVDDNLVSIKSLLDEYSANWIRDEVGKNNYIETLDDARPLSELPNGLIRRYASSTPVEQTVIAKDPAMAFNQQMTGNNIIKQINIYKKTTAKGWFTTYPIITLIRSYIVAKAGNLNLSIGSYINQENPRSTHSTNAQVQMLNRPTYDDIICELKTFDIKSLKPTPKEKATQDFIQTNLTKYVGDVCYSTDEEPELTRQPTPIPPLRQPTPHPEIPPLPLSKELPPPSWYVHPLDTPLPQPDNLILPTPPSSPPLPVEDFCTTAPGFNPFGFSLHDYLKTYPPHLNQDNSNNSEQSEQSESDDSELEFPDYDEIIDIESFSTDDSSSDLSSDTDYDSETEQETILENKKNQ